MNQRRPPASARPAAKRPARRSGRRPPPAAAQRALALAAQPVRGRPRGRGGHRRGGLGRLQHQAPAGEPADARPPSSARPTSPHDCGPDNAIATFSARRTGSTSPSTRCPKVLDRRGAGHRGPQVLPARRRGPGRHRPRLPQRHPRARASEQGGSTITQQYVKNVYLSSERSITRKLKEAVLAVKLERELDKNQILERYLNTIYFGRGAYGVGAAARAYFGKDVRTIGLPEAAYLAGLIRAPEAGRRPGPPAGGHPPPAAHARRDGPGPRHHHRPARRRPTRCRGPARSSPAATAPSSTSTRTSRPSAAPTSSRPCASRSRAKYGDAVLYGGGLRIYVTLDPAMQKDGVERGHDHAQPAGRPGRPRSWPSMTRARSRPWSAGRDYATQKVNYALGAGAAGRAARPGRRSSRSCWPPRCSRASRSTRSSTAPAQITLPKANNGADWVVHNYADAGPGRPRPRRRHPGVLQHGLRPADAPGGPAERGRPGPQDGRVTAKLPRGELARAGHRGRVPARHGRRASAPSPTAASTTTRTWWPRSSRSTEDGTTRVLEQAHPTGDRVLTAQESDLVTYALRQVVTNGTGHAANFGRRVAGKTGTTDKNGERLVRRLHAQAHRLGVDGLRQPAGHAGQAHGPRPRDRGHRRHAPGADLEQVHAQRHRRARTGLLHHAQELPGQGPQRQARADAGLDQLHARPQHLHHAARHEGSTTTSTTFPIGFPFDTTTSTTKPTARRPRHDEARARPRRCRRATRTRHRPVPTDFRKS